MADEKKEKWLNWLALTTLIFSAAATLGSSKAGGYSSKAMSEQIKASDQWAFFQAKSIKQHTFDLQREALSLAMLPVAEPIQAKYKEAIERIAKDVSRYDAEKKEIKAQAADHEKNRDVAAVFAGLFARAVLYLQVAIIVSALAALMKKQPLWLVSFVPGIIGMVYFIRAFWLTW